MQVSVTVIDEAANVYIRTDYRVHVFFSNKFHFVRIISLLLALDLRTKIVHVFLK